MPPLNSRETRQLVRQRNQLAGPRSLHRGIHLDLNEDATRSYRAASARTDSRDGRDASASKHRDLLVHHQKISEDLSELYLRTSQLHKDNLTMEERIEESWKAFERIGGRVPTRVSAQLQNARQQKDRATLIAAERRSNRGSNSAVLCVAPGATPYAEHLAQLSAEKKSLRERAAWERATRGEAVDYGDGRGALHALKDRRVKDFQRRQLKRAHLLRRYGDPTPLKQSGRFDDQTATLRVFNKTMRNVQREVARDERIAAVHQPRRRSGRGDSSSSSGSGNTAAAPRSQWNVRSAGNVNRPDTELLRESRDWEVGPQNRRRSSAGRGRKRGRE